MKGIWLLLLLILAAALPVLIVFLWLRAKKSVITPAWFLASLSAGMASLFTAAIIQRFFLPSGDGFWLILFGIFVRIAFVEEASRLLTLIPLFIAGRRRQFDDPAFGAALGLVSGLGFALIENALMGLSALDITLLRAITSAPLHAACGIRAGIAVFTFPRNKIKALLFFIPAVLIHGTYNLVIANPTFPSLIAVPLAFSFLFSALPFIKNAGAKDDTVYS
jgi:RsiW-degrading membrane proteinase PrsW (M82 family)